MLNTESGRNMMYEQMSNAWSSGGLNNNVYQVIVVMAISLFFFHSVLEDDLAVWKNGITKEKFDSAKSKGTHYQIINHKLYREEKCMFPARYVTLLTLSLSCLTLN